MIVTVVEGDGSDWEIQSPRLRPAVDSLLLEFQFAAIDVITALWRCVGRADGSARNRREYE